MDKSTNRKLISAYAKLLKKDVDRITVSLLCERADVARATFYIHYKDMSDFKDALHRYLIDKFFEQATLFLCCDENDFVKNLKKENLLFNDNELIILKDMVSGSNYIEFAQLSDKYFLKELKSSVFAENVQTKFKDELDIFIRGYLPILVIGLTDYNETVFRSDVKNCRLFFKFLCKRVASQ